MEKIVTNLQQAFLRQYGNPSELPTYYFAPGRVNLIGEHTDYNGGFVLPCALTFGTYMALRKTKGQSIKMSSVNFEGTCEVLANKPFLNTRKTWSNYPLGVIDQFQKIEPKITGLEITFLGDVPQGAGLSSSASIETVTAFAINDLFDYNLSKVDLARLGQKAENEFVGMNCGIMDQFSSSLGMKDNAIFLNCRTLNYSHVPAIMENYVLIISNTNKTRGLVDSKYNERRSECQSAVEFLKPYCGIEQLGQLSIEQFDEFKNKIQDPVILKRATHIIHEDQRVLEAVNALFNGNLELFGQLMNQSHESLKNDYEVSCTELDILVEEALRIPGTLGSRMTGAGFGGCTVSVVRKKDINEFCTKVGHNYQVRAGLRADFYVANIGNGAGKINELV